MRLGAGEGHEGLWDGRGRSRGGLDLGGSEPLAFSRRARQAGTSWKEVAPIRRRGGGPALGARGDASEQ